MSRNIGYARCKYCGSDVVLDGNPHPATPDEVWGEYLGMIIENAECPECKAKYMAWRHWEHRDTDYWANPDWAENKKIMDLSFRSSFNDEPGDDDLPDFVFEELIYFVKHKAPNYKQCGKRRVGGYGCFCRDPR